MSYCLKTGGLLHDLTSGTYYECDLHVQGDQLIAVTCQPQHEIEDGERRGVFVTIQAPTEVFYRHWPNTPYGILVAPMNRCRVSAEMKEHLDNWYSEKKLRFANYG